MTQLHYDGGAGPENSWACAGTQQVLSLGESETQRWQQHDDLDAPTSGVGELRPINGTIDCPATAGATK